MRPYKRQELDRQGERQKTISSFFDVGKPSNDYGIGILARSGNKVMVLFRTSDCLPFARLAAFNEDLVALDGVACFPVDPVIFPSNRLRQFCLPGQAVRMPGQ